MPFFKFDNIKISGIASAVPKTVVNIDSFKNEFGEEVVNKFKKMTGVESYRKTSIKQTASDLGYEAAEKLLLEKRLNREDIKLLIFVAHSSDYWRPATACVLHKRLNLSSDCAAIDINLGCSAVIYGLQTACSMMLSSDIEQALVIVGETMTKMVNQKDKSTVMLFGDGGGALLLEKIENNSHIEGVLKSDGNRFNSIIAPAGGFRNRFAIKDDFICEDGNIRSLYDVNMNGTDVFSFSISDVPETIQELFEKTKTTVNDYDCFAFHQANAFIHKQLLKRFKIPVEKAPLSIHKYGNTSAASIPLTLCDCYGEINDNSEINVLMCGFGVGLSWGALNVKLNKNDIFSVVETDSFFEEGFFNSPDDI